MISVKLPTQEGFVAYKRRYPFSNEGYFWNRVETDLGGTKTIRFLLLPTEQGNGNEATIRSTIDASQLTATLVDSLGTDLTVVNSARVSFNKESKFSVSEMGVFLNEKIRSY